MEAIPAPQGELSGFGCQLYKVVDHVRGKTFLYINEKGQIHVPGTMTIGEAEQALRIARELAPKLGVVA